MHARVKKPSDTDNLASPAAEPTEVSYPATKRAQALRARLDATSDRLGAIRQERSNLALSTDDDAATVARRREIRQEIDECVDTIQALGDAIEMLQAEARAEGKNALYRRRITVWRNALTRAEKLRKLELELQALAKVTAETLLQQRSLEKSIRETVDLWDDSEAWFGSPRVVDAFIGQLVRQEAIHHDMTPQRYRTGLTLSSELEPVHANADLLIEQIRARMPISPQAEHALEQERREREAAEEARWAAMQTGDKAQDVWTTTSAKPFTLYDAEETKFVAVDEPELNGEDMELGGDIDLREVV